MADHKAVNSGLVQLSDEQYDFFRAFLEKVFPAAGALYALLGTYFHWNNVVEVTGSIAGIAVFLGVVLSLARKGYTPLVDVPKTGYDGQVVEDVVDGQSVLRVALKPEATEELFNKPQLVIKGFEAGA
jgi:hypothetical protein